MKTDKDFWSRVIEDIKKSESATYHRGKSWIHCYLFFRNYRKIRNSTNLQDRAALHLGFFLASWGMLRGSSFLLQQDYKIYIPIVRILINLKYDPLWNASYQKLSIQKAEEILDLLFDLKNILRHKFKEECEDCETPTDLLITKIMMATMGCAPAYDTYFKKGLKKFGIKYYSNFSRKSFKNLLDACNKSEAIRKIYKIRQPVAGTHYLYPPMKLLDLYCWLYGQ